MEQEIADLKNKLARKEEAQRKLADGQKIIIGGMMLALAERDDSARKRLVELLEKHVTRDADLRRIKPLIAELKNGTAAKSPEKNTPPPSEHKQAPRPAPSRTFPNTQPQIHQEPPDSRAALASNFLTS